MGTLPPIFNGCSRAITAAEFYDALQATCPPRFRRKIITRERQVALAISGGVDSMALAFLCRQVKKCYPSVRISDSPVSSFSAYIIDHGLRPGSRQEAEQVSKALKGHLKMRAEIRSLRWTDAQGAIITNPAELSNVETVARRLRYREIGHWLALRSIGSLLLAHHEDDQYETVLMRLLGGHGYRGLRGMSPAQDIPECQDMHGAYQSGLIDDQSARDPYYKSMPSTSTRKGLKKQLRSEIDDALRAMHNDQPSGRADMEWSLVEDQFEPSPRPPVPPLARIPIEDGGVKVYRPLLEFPKERLIATCVENNIPWFEDTTNADRTLTMRNAVRHMVKHHVMPSALQKPSILGLAARCRQRIAAEEAEAERRLPQMVVREFEPNTGTAVIQMPEFPLPSAPRRTSKSEVRQQKRKKRYRLVAEALIRRALSLVSPELQFTIPSHLDIVSLLFPSLTTAKSSQRSPKAFIASGVFFIPLIGDHPLRWYLCRAPYSDKTVHGKGLPCVTVPGGLFSKRWNLHPRHWKMRRWHTWELVDGRWWARLRHRLPHKMRIAPFQQEHYKSFREALSREERRRLERLLRRYAPGKVRWTLPAIYAPYDSTHLLRGEDHWPKELQFSGPQEDLPNPRSSVPFLNRLKFEHRKLETPRPTLLALPTLGVQLPGVDEWVEWEFRYRKVDDGLLQKSLDVEDWEALLHRHEGQGLGVGRLGKRRWPTAVARRRTRIPRRPGTRGESASV
ncbi:hypothetical protein GQ53DRAFT_698671 [Thozetella sp. PMI_491]|nr:hypothetical protein GQ53DRAFT_698671 [Thozetella sp. PMI_491]